MSMILERPNVANPVPTLPASLYRDPAQFERERQAIFTKEWLLYGRTDQLAKPGDYLALTIVGYPVVVVRQKDGTLKGFHNVCRHRAAALAQNPEGAFSGGMIRCPYHSWTYELNGCLNRSPGFGAEKGAIDPAQWSLFPISADEWRGLVFVRIATTGPTLVEWLGPIVPMAAQYPLQDQRFFMEKNQEVAIDWKVYGENYLECYHCPNMHPGLCESLDISKYTIDSYPEDGFFHLYGPRRDGGFTDGLYFYRFPFLMLNFYQWGSSIATVEPLGAGRLRHINWYLFSDLSPEKAEENRRSAEWSAQIVAEDMDMNVTVQRNLEVGVYDRGVLSPKQERAVGAFQNMVRAAMPGLEG